jgi:hypothetical protein
MDHRTKRPKSLFFWNRVDDALAQTEESATDITAVDPDREKYLNGCQSIRGRKPAFRGTGLFSLHDLERDDGTAHYRHSGPERNIDSGEADMTVKFSTCKGLLKHGRRTGNSRLGCRDDF